jgi:hypothetical protein
VIIDAVHFFDVLALAHHAKFKINYYIAFHPKITLDDQIEKRERRAKIQRSIQREGTSGE